MVLGIAVFAALRDSWKRGGFCALRYCFKATEESLSHCFAVNIDDSFAISVALRDGFRHWGRSIGLSGDDSFIFEILIALY